MSRTTKFFSSAILWLLLTSCTKPPDVPICKPLIQRITTDSATGHTMLTPSSACMVNLGEASCGYCTWLVSGKGQFLGEKHQQVQQRELSDTGKKDAKGNKIYEWAPVVDSSNKPVMISSWLNDVKPWSQVQSESMYLPAEESYAPLATYTINSCRQNNCSDDIDTFKVKLDSLNGISGALSN